MVKQFSDSMTDIQRAARLLTEGGVLAYPTEAVWGLGADPNNEQAVQKILQLKSRPVDKGLILIAASTKQLGSLFDELNPSQKQRLLSSWPGPHTWLLPDKADQVPRWIKGNHPSVAVRVTQHPLVVQLCQVLGSALVSTSANPAGEPEARSPEEVLEYFDNVTGSDGEPLLTGLLHGPLGKTQQPSTITDLLTGKRLR